jgi:hydrogenase maturation protease
VSRESARMARILIVGYGNPLRSDDGLGWRAAEVLSQAFSWPNVEVTACHQLTPELAADLQHADAVIFIDAAQGGQPGELKCEPVTSRAEDIGSHQLSQAGILALAEQLYRAKPLAFAVSLCGECFDHGTALSATVEAALPQLLERVEELTAQVLREAEPCSLIRPV